MIRCPSEFSAWKCAHRQFLQTIFVGLCEVVRAFLHQRDGISQHVVLRYHKRDIGYTYFFFTSLILYKYKSMQVYYRQCVPIYLPGLDKNIKLVTQGTKYCSVGNGMYSDPNQTAKCPKNCVAQPSSSIIVSDFYCVCCLVVVYVSDYCISLVHNLCSY